MVTNKSNVIRISQTLPWSITSSSANWFQYYLLIKLRAFIEKFFGDKFFQNRGVSFSHVNLSGRNSILEAEVFLHDSKLYDFFDTKPSRRVLKRATKKFFTKPKKVSKKLRKLIKKRSQFFFKIRKAGRFRRRKIFFFKDFKSKNFRFLITKRRFKRSRHKRLRFKFVRNYSKSFGFSTFQYKLKINKYFKSKFRTLSRFRKIARKVYNRFKSKKFRFFKIFKPKRARRRRSFFSKRNFLLFRRRARVFFHAASSRFRYNENKKKFFKRSHEKPIKSRRRHKYVTEWKPTWGNPYKKVRRLERRFRFPRFILDGLARQLNGPDRKPLSRTRTRSKKRAKLFRMKKNWTPGLLNRSKKALVRALAVHVVKRLKLFSSHRAKATYRANVISSNLRLARKRAVFFRKERFLSSFFDKVPSELGHSRSLAFISYQYLIKKFRRKARLVKQKKLKRFVSKRVLKRFFRTVVIGKKLIKRKFFKKRFSVIRFPIRLKVDPKIKAKIKKFGLRYRRLLKRFKAKLIRIKVKFEVLRFVRFLFTNRRKILKARRKRKFLKYLYEFFPKKFVKRHNFAHKTQKFNSPFYRPRFEFTYNNKTDRPVKSRLNGFPTKQKNKSKYVRYYHNNKNNNNRSNYQRPNSKINKSPKFHPKIDSYANKPNNFSNSASPRPHKPNYYNNPRNGKPNYYNNPRNGKPNYYRYKNKKSFYKKKNTYKSKWIRYPFWRIRYSPVNPVSAKGSRFMFFTQHSAYASVKFVRYSFFSFISKFLSSQIFKFFQVPVSVRFSFFPLHRAGSDFYLNYITSKLYYRYILSDVIKPLIKLSKKFYRGFVVNCKGRFTRAQIAVSKKFSKRPVSYSRMSSLVDYNQRSVVLKYGTCNLRIWIRK
jgi:hypothetical protein